MIDIVVDREIILKHVVEETFELVAELLMVVALLVLARARVARRAGARQAHDPVESRGRDKFGRRSDQAPRDPW